MTSSLAALQPIRSCGCGCTIAGKGRSRVKARQMSSNGSSTVVIGLNWVGDNVLALPTYRALHHRFRQEGGISVAAPEHIATLLSATGIFRRVIAWNGDTRDRIRLLKEGRFHRAVILPNSFRAAMIAFASAHNGIPMVGHDGDVLQLAAAISHCSVVVTNDSGPLHLATALAVPSVLIFGPTDPARTVIPGASRVLQRPFACQPCYKRECPLMHHRCMTEISVEDVFNAAVGLFHEIEGKIEEAADGEVRVL